MHDWLLDDVDVNVDAVVVVVVANAVVAGDDVVVLYLIPSVFV